VDILVQVRDLNQRMVRLEPAKGGLVQISKSWFKSPDLNHRTEPAYCRP
jgi:hypothetical protein